MVGIDWGALAAWHLSLMRPDRVKGIVAFCVPFMPRSATVKSLELFRQMFGEDYYFCQFQVNINSSKLEEERGREITLMKAIGGAGSRESREGFCEVRLFDGSEEVYGDQEHGSAHSTTRNGNY